MLASKRRQRQGFAPGVAAGLLATVLVVALATPGAAAVAGSAAPDGSSVTVDSEEIAVGADGQLVRTSRALHAEVDRTPAGTGHKPASVAVQPVVKVSPRLATRLAARAAADQRIRVMVTFVEDQRIPRFPDSDQNQPEMAAANVAAQAKADGLVRDITARREPGYRAFDADIQRLGGRVIETYWLIKGLQAEIPLSAVTTLAARPDVQYVEPAEGGVLPMAGNTVDVARNLLNTDPYFTSGLAGDRVAIMDTGVQSSHFLLSNPSPLGTGFDFTGEGGPFSDVCDHGTKTAAVISGNGRLGNEYRGIGGIKINVYKIIPFAGVNHPCEGSPFMATAGFQAAIDRREKVIVAPIGTADNENSMLSALADQAFGAGAVVIAANGNTPGPGQVLSPANARKVLGIGAVDIQTFARFPDQSEGPTGDGRIKPDLVAPTNVDTATGGGAATGIYGSTSAASSLAGGAAAVYRNFLRGSAADIDPGHVYAGMILGGSSPGAPFSNVEGAGKLRLSPRPPTSNAIYTRFTVTGTPGTANGISAFIGVPANTPSTCRLSASLWWGEDFGVHNDYDLNLIDPSGVTRASSVSSASVFELARVDAPLTAGVWKVRVKPFRPVVGAPVVYVAVSTCR